MLKIEVLESKVSERRRNDKSYRVQKCAVFLPGEKYPRPFDLFLGKDAGAYPIGFYTLAPESFRVFADSLEFRPSLIAQQAARAAAAG